MSITQNNLNNLTERLNKITGMPDKMYTENKGANIGNYHIDNAYGGVSLHQFINTSGGIQDTFNCGYIPKKELYYRIHAFLAGIILNK